MMTTSHRDNRTLLEGMYAAEARYLAAGGQVSASFEVIAPFFAPDVVLHQDAGLPYGGTWRGHDGMERFFATMSRTWDVFEMVEQELLATGRTSVVLTHVHARAEATGVELDFPILQTLEIVDGRIAEVRRLLLEHFGGLRRVHAHRAVYSRLIGARELRVLVIVTVATSER